MDRRQLLPDLPLPVRRGGPGLRRPPGHRGHRRDGRRGHEHGPGRRHPRSAGLHHLLARDDQRADPRGARSGDPRAGGPRQEPPQRGAVVDRQRAGVPHRGRRAVLQAALRADQAARSHPAGRLRQRGAGLLRQVPRVAVRRRGHAQPLLRLVSPHRRPGDRRAGLGAGAQGLGQRGQADHHHRVRRRHLPWAPLAHRPAVVRGVPGGAPGHEPPGVRPRRRRRRRAGLGVRGLRHGLGHRAGRRQQEGRLHPRPPAQVRRPRPAPPLEEDNDETYPLEGLVAARSS